MDIKKSNYRILYKSAEGVLAIITPADNCELSVQEIAEKDVPAGFPFKIVMDTDIPEEDEYRNAWTIDDDLLTDGIGKEHGNPAESGYLIPLKDSFGNLKSDEQIKAELESVLLGDRP